MPQSLSKVLIHIIFSTKNRAPYLKDPAFRERLNGYMVGTLENLRCPSLQVGAVEDHIHILCHLSRTMSVAEKRSAMSAAGFTPRRSEAVIELGGEKLSQAVTGLKHRRNPAQAVPKLASDGPSAALAGIPWGHNVVLLSRQP